MALDRKSLRPAPAIQRPPVTAIRSPSPAASAQSRVSALQQRLGNQGAQALLPRVLGSIQSAKPETNTAPSVSVAAPVEARAPAQPPQVVQTPSGEQAPGAPDSSGHESVKISPKNPQQDPAFQAVIKHTRRTKAAVQKSKPLEHKQGQIKAASHLPVKEQSEYNDRKTHLNTIDKTAANNKDASQVFTAGQFKTLFGEKVGAIEKDLPHDEAGASRFKREKPLDRLKKAFGLEVKTQQEKVGAPITRETGKQEAPPSGIETHAPKDVMEEKPGSKPRPIDPVAASPKPLDDSEISLEKESKSLDELMAKNNNTEEQFAESNEPKFTKALSTKKEAQAKAAEAPKQYRAKEERIRAGAQNEAQREGSSGFAAMFGSRVSSFAETFTTQKQTAKEDVTKQAAVKRELDRIYNSTKNDVEEIFSKLTEYVDTTFNKEANDAKNAFEERVEDQLDDIHGYGVKEFFVGEDTEAIEAVFAKEKKRFLDALDRTLDIIAQRIANDLNRAVKRIADGEAEAERFYGTLDNDQQKLASDSMETLRLQFQTLRTSVDEKQSELAQTLAESYQQNRKSLRATFDKINEETKKNWIQRAIDFIKEVALTIYRLGELLVTVLVRIAHVVGDILAHPIRFLENLAAGIKQGFKTFTDNFDTYLIGGFFEWLKGKVGTSIKLPAKFDTAGLFSLALQVIGLTYENFRRIAAQKLGEPIVAGFEKGVEGAQEIYKLLQMARNDIGALWTYIKDAIANSVDEIFEKIKKTVLYEVIKKVLAYIVTLFNPAGAFIKAAQAIYAGIRFLMDNMERIAQLVNAFLDGVEMAVKGNVGGIAAKVVTGLQNAIVMGIDFLAKLLGLGNLDDKVRTIIKQLSAPVERAMGFVVDKLLKPLAKVAVKAGKAIMEWWKRRKRFKAGGETHEMYFTGTEKTAQLMVASDPQVVSTFVKKVVIKSSDPNKNKKEKAIKAIDAALGIMTREMAKATDKQDKAAIVNAFETVGDNLPVLVELNTDDDREVGEINVERPSFTEKVRKLVTINADKEDRRHIVSSKDMAEHYETCLRKSKMWEAAQLLLERGQPVQKPLSDKKIESAAKQRHKRFFNDVHNLFPGSLEENRSLGRTIDPKPGMGPKKLRDHIEYIKARWALKPNILKPTGM